MYGYQPHHNRWNRLEALFTGRSAFRSRDPLFQGMTGHNYTLSLDLEAGEKELVFAVTERREFYARLVELEALRGVICPSAQPSEWGVHSMIVTP